MKVYKACWTIVLRAVAEFCVGAAADENYGGWFGHKGVQVRSIIALEGGSLTYSNGTYYSQNGGVYLTLDLTKPFNNSENDTAIFQSAKSLGSDSDNPNYINGHMFHNGQSWFTFAGEPTKKLPSVDANSVRRGDLFGSNAGTFASGSLRIPVDNVSGVHENIAMAAYASSPDSGQSLGWIFGGMAQPDWSTILYPPRNVTLLSQPLFYQVDMKSSSVQATFKALEAPPQLQASPRAQGGLVWLPFGRQGILIALGGVAVPADIFPSPPTVLPTNNTFMSDLLIYDIAGQKWYSQSTLEGDTKPPQMAGFCTAVISTNDSYSQQIIVYGGSDGTARYPALDDVWILSIPEFQWTYVKVNGNTDATTHGRRGSVCFAPNPSSFITVGGTAIRGNPLKSNTFVDVLDLTTWTWTGAYDPTSNASYSAPPALVSQLGWPSSNGPGRRMVGNVGDSALSSLLNTTYPTRIAPLYPYASPSSTTSSPPGPTTSAAASGPGPNTALIASLATVLPLLAIAAIIAFFCIRRRNKRGVKRTQDNRSTVSSWLGRSSTIDPRGEKSQADTEETIINSPDDHFYTSPVVPAVQRKGDDIYEADPHSTATPSARSPGQTSTAIGNHEYFEIMDHPPRGAAALAAHKNNPVGGSELGSNKPASELPHASSRENLSVPSGGVIAGASQPSPISRKPVADRRESTPLPSPSTPNMGHTRGTSDVSSAVLTASPNTDFRRSQHIDSLPDHPGLGEGRATPTMQGRSSAYKEKFDDQ